MKCSRERLDLGSTGETGASIPMFQPVCSSGDGCNQPEKRTGQVYPHGVLHAFDVSVAMGVFVDVKLSEDSKQSDPQDEQDGIPNGDEYPSGFNDEGHEVEGTRSRCQSADDDGIDPFGFGVIVKMLRPL